MSETAKLTSTVVVPAWALPEVNMVTFEPGSSNCRTIWSRTVRYSPLTGWSGKWYATTSGATPVCCISRSPAFGIGWKVTDRTRESVTGGGGFGSNVFTGLAAGGGMRTSRTGVGLTTGVCLAAGGAGLLTDVTTPSGPPTSTNGTGSPPNASDT